MVRMTTRAQGARPVPPKERPGPEPVERIPESKPRRSRWVPVLAAALAVRTVAFLGLAAVTLRPRLRPTGSERLVRDVAAAWDAGSPAALAQVYARDAVIVRPDGSKLVGIKAIVAAAHARGQDFTMTESGPISLSPDGTSAAAGYRFAGDGRGTGIYVIRVSGGKVTRQWDFLTQP